MSALRTRVCSILPREARAALMLAMLRALGSISPRHLLLRTTLHSEVSERQRYRWFTMMARGRTFMRAPVAALRAARNRVSASEEAQYAPLRYFSVTTSCARTYVIRHHAPIR